MRSFFKNPLKLSNAEVGATSTRCLERASYRQFISAFIFALYFGVRLFLSYNDPMRKHSNFDWPVFLWAGGFISFLAFALWQRELLFVEEALRRKLLKTGIEITDPSTELIVSRKPQRTQTVVFITLGFVTALVILELLK